MRELTILPGFPSHEWAFAVRIAVQRKIVVPPAGCIEFWYRYTSLGYKMYTSTHHRVLGPAL